jgi:hypothetical protein
MYINSEFSAEWFDCPGYRGILFPWLFIAPNEGMGKAGLYCKRNSFFAIPFLATLYLAYPDYFANTDDLARMENQRPADSHLLSLPFEFDWRIIVFWIAYKLKWKR